MLAPANTLLIMATRLDKRLPNTRGGALLSRTRERMKAALRVVKGSGTDASNDRDGLADAEASEPDAAVPRTRVARGTSSRESYEAQAARLEARMQHDMRLARTIQQRFLPSVPEVHNGVRMHASYCPAYEIVGDFYDLIEIDRYRFQVIIGDVSGKGVAAALIMSRIIAEFRRAAHSGLAPDQVLDDVNRFLFSRDLPAGFVTATCIEVDLKTRSLRLANAGHLPTVARRKLTGATWMFGEASGAPLGMLEGEVYSCETFYFEPGDIIVMVTDGVTEAIEPNADPSAGVLTGIVADGDCDLSKLTAEILEAVETSEQVRLADDVALFAMQLA